MAVAGRSGETETASSVADALGEAAFVRLLAEPDGDALAAAGLLARALTERTTPFQASVVRTERPATETTDDTTTVLVGRDGPAEITLRGEPRPASETAFEACRELGTEPNPVLALAGAFAAASEIEGSAAFEAAREREWIEQRPGIAVPVPDTADGLTHTTLAHAPFSGEEEETAATLEGRTFDEDDRRRQVASLLALSAMSVKESTARAAETVERALRPYAITGPDEGDGPVDAGFETIGGYADVLRANAREQPGTGLALALGHDAREAALSAWRVHAKRAHTALRAATTERHRNVFIVHVGTDAALATTARLACDFRSPEPVALVLAETEAAAAACEDANLGQRMDEAATTAGGSGEGTARRGRARFDDSEAFVAAFREAMA